MSRFRSLLAISAALGLATLLWRRFARRLTAQIRAMSHPAPVGSTGRARPTVVHSSAASAAGEAWRDDRDVLGVTGPLPEHELPLSKLEPTTPQRERS
jgi:hypothetical protein